MPQSHYLCLQVTERWSGSCWIWIPMVALTHWVCFLFSWRGQLRFWPLVSTEKWNTSELCSERAWKIIDDNSRPKNKMEKHRSYARTISRNMAISCKGSDWLQIWTQHHKRIVVRNTGHCIILTTCKSWHWKVGQSWNYYSRCWRSVWFHLVSAAQKTPFAELLRESLLLRIKERRNNKLVGLIKY